MRRAIVLAFAVFGLKFPLNNGLKFQNSAVPGRSKSGKGVMKFTSL